MDPVLLARIQFAFTIAVHFIFPPLTIGMSWIITYMLSRYLATRQPLYKDMARFWIRIFGVTFAAGVATGITMEFQFGTNWSAYSRFVGDIFGAPLAIEAIFTFFLESTFLGILLFGWNRVSPRSIWFASLMVSIGATLSAFWILVANSWQQTPAGYHLVNGRAELTDFFAAVFNQSTFPRFFHTVMAAFITGSFFMLSLSAIMLLARRSSHIARKTLQISLPVALVASCLQIPLGHWHATQVVETQPTKLAAFEAHFRTEKPAFQTLIGIPDEENMTVKYAIRIPTLLSILAYGNVWAEVKGLEEFPRDEWPPVTLTFLSFRLMVGLGTLFVLLPAWGLYLHWRRRVYAHRLFLWAAMLALPLPTFANQLGWVTAEVGRQPWIVWHLMRTRDAISVTVPASHIVFSLIVFAILYAALIILWIYTMVHIIRKAPTPTALQSDLKESTR